MIRIIAQHSVVVVSILTVMASAAFALDGSVVYVTNNTSHTVTMKTVVPCTGSRCKGKHLKTKYWEGGQKAYTVGPWQKVRLFKTNRDSGIKRGANYHFNTTIKAKGWQSVGTPFQLRVKLRGKHFNSTMWQGVRNSRNQTSFHKDRKTRKATWSLKKGGTQKNIRVSYRAYFTGGDDNVEFIIQDPTVRHVWMGTAPTCKGRKSDCEALDMDFIKKDKRGDGHKCLNSGHKVLCVERKMPKVNRTGDKVTTFNLLNWNIFSRPFIASHDGQIERMAHIPRVLASLNKGMIDAVVFEEAFIAGKGFRRDLKRAGFPYATKVTPALKKFGALTNGGVFIASRWPILKEAHETYNNSSGSDSMAAKGIVYAKIRKKVGTRSKLYHVFGTHMQAWHTPGKRAVRIKQAKQLHRYIKKRKIPARESVLIAGDLNEDLLHNLEWIGTAPACAGNKRDCTRNGMTYVRSDKRGNGKRCVTGRKVLCKKRMIKFGAGNTAYTGTDFAKKLMDATGGVLPPRKGSRSATSNPKENVLVGSDGAASDHGCGDAYSKNHKCTCCHKEFLDFVLYSKRHQAPTTSSYEILRPRAAKPFPVCMSAKMQPHYVQSFSDFCGSTWMIRDLSDHYPVLGRFDFAPRPISLTLPVIKDSLIAVLRYWHHRRGEIAELWTSKRRSEFKAAGYGKVGTLGWAFRSAADASRYASNLGGKVRKIGNTVARLSFYKRPVRNQKLKIDYFTDTNPKYAKYKTHDKAAYVFTKNALIAWPRLAPHVVPAFRYYHRRSKDNSVAVSKHDHGQAKKKGACLTCGPKELICSPRLIQKALSTNRCAIGYFAKKGQWSQRPCTQDSECDKAKNHVCLKSSSGARGRLKRVSTMGTKRLRVQPLKMPLKNLVKSGVCGVESPK